MDLNCYLRSSNNNSRKWCVPGQNEIKIRIFYHFKIIIKALQSSVQARIYEAERKEKKAESQLRQAEDKAQRRSEEDDNLRM